MERRSILGMQFDAAGVVADDLPIDPLDVSDDEVYRAAVNGVSLGVGLVLYHYTADGQVEVFLVNRVNSAVNGPWLPATDMARDDTLEDTARRLASRFLGLELSPDINRYLEVGLILVRSPHTARGQQVRCQDGVMFLGYLVSQEEQRSIRLNTTAEGGPSPKRVFASGRWANLDAVLHDPVTYPTGLRAVLRRFGTELARASGE